MQREDSATNWLNWSSGSVSMFGLRLRTYAIVLPASPIPGVIVITLVMYVLSGKSEVGPIACQLHDWRLKIGAIANPSAGRVNAAAAMPPTPLAHRFMNARRVTVSPSKAPGMFRSMVYFDLVCLRRSGTAPCDSLLRVDVDSVPPRPRKRRHIRPRYAVA